MSLRSLSPLENLGVLRAYLSAYRRLRPAAALHFTIKPVIFGSLAARLTGAKAINTITGLGNVFLRQDLLTALVIALYRPALKRAGRVFFQNGEDLEAFRVQKLVRPDQIERVGGSGVNLERFAVAQAPRGERFTFLFIARLLVEKGLMDFLEAARTLPRDQVRLVVAGPTASESDGGAPQSVLEAWQAEGIIEYAGALADVRPLIASADCVVLPTYYREGVPRVLLEAGAMGRPAIATDVVGCRDVIVDGQTGLLCRPRDPASLADAMRRMMALSAEARAEMGLKARARIEALFDERAVVAAYLRAIAGPEVAS